MKNNTTTWTGVAGAVSTLLTILAALPYQLGDLATVIPAEWKEKVVLTGLIATAILKVWNSIASADAKQVAKLSDKVDHIDAGTEI